MSALDPWRDPTRYKDHGDCLGCSGRGGGPWGNWCHKCNVERMERIDASFARIEAEFKRREKAEDGGGP